MIGFCVYPGCKNTQMGCFRTNCKFIYTGASNRIATLEKALEEVCGVIENFRFADPKAVNVAEHIWEKTIKERDSLRDITIDFIDQMRVQGLDLNMLPAEYDTLVESVKKFRKEKWQ